MPDSRSSAAPDCLLIADDLTGACDAAVHFAQRGWPATVLTSLDQRWDAVRVLAVNAESRDLAPEEVPPLMAAIANSLPVHKAGVIFKKIDSTLRGSPGVEIRTAVEAFGCDVAVIIPAFPVMNRVVEDGRLRVTSEPKFQPVDVAALLRAQGAIPCSHVQLGAIAEAVEFGARFLTVDAITDTDLDRIAVETLLLDRRVLWAGSAGLASSLAWALTGIPERLPGDKPAGGAVLFCIGSDHPATLAQQARLIAERRAVLLDAETAASECIAETLRRGEHVVLRIPRAGVALEQIGRLVSGAPAAALVLSGGDTASLMCRAAGARHIDLRYEIAPGIPWGVLKGGQFDKLPVATKAGGFGDPDALVQVVDFFS